MPAHIHSAKLQRRTFTRNNAAQRPTARKRSAAMRVADFPAKRCSAGGATCDGQMVQDASMKTKTSSAKPKRNRVAVTLHILRSRYDVFALASEEIARRTGTAPGGGGNDGV